MCDFFLKQNNKTIKAQKQNKKTAAFTLNYSL